MIDYDQFVLPENPILEDHLVATYLLRTSAPDLLQLAATMATEQTVGTWIGVPGETREMLRKHRGKVLNVWEIPDIENDVSRSERGDRRECVVQIAYPSCNFGGQIPMILTTAFGNISMIGDIKLLDLAFPRTLTAQLPGPRFGIPGVRDLLGVAERPLLNTMIKPSTGITPEQGAELLYAAAVGGTDIVKDDEVLPDTDFSPALRRVELYMKNLRRAEAETGEKKIYTVNVTDEPERCLRRAEAAVEAGANGVMINFLTAGIALLSSLARNPKIRVPILAHLDFGGALYASPRHGISSPLLYGKLARLAGVDLVTIPTPYGKFALTREKYLRSILGLRGDLHDTRAAWPIVGGAIKQGHLPQLFSDLGRDFVVGAGGAIYAHPMGPTGGAKAFRQGIDVVMKRGTFDGAEKEYPELAAAVERWGSSVER
ncbi:ribulose 1,5-bisphosphate carboxylase [Candidatus Sumerlaeota bacterium]|nr:ribulose 1,5-bisphosphate carboxylase [Candidatus Sumerlaeota bacterium]